MNQIIYPADILLPDKNTNMSKWSVIACDQFTSQPEYWDDVEKYVGKAPSTFRLTLPEVYLETDEEENRLKGIRDSMEDYIKKGMLKSYPDSLFYIERTDSTGKLRAGIIGAVDLEEYDYHKGSKTPVRATEGTIVERIPPRLRVRNNAPIELPHTMILIDDRKKMIIESLAKRTADMELLYDFDLMKKGGHLKGWRMDPESKKMTLKGLAALAKEEAALDDAPLICAVGDGNHSLATAKEYYEQLKQANPGKDFTGHPARYALAEIVNLHSPALEFEAIHRIVTNVNIEDLFAHMTRALGLVRDSHHTGHSGHGHDSGSIAEMESSLDSGKEKQSMIIVIKGQEEKVTITRPTSRLTVGSLQNFLDEYIKEHAETGDIKVDYIHGKNNLKALTWQNGSIGFILPDMAKEELFPSVKANGALPRKTFSMGHAEDKRYYTECKKISDI